jgi:hypothetical protein
MASSTESDLKELKVGAIVVGALLRTLRETRTAPTGCVGNYHNPNDSTSVWLLWDELK